RTPAIGLPLQFGGVLEPEVVLFNDTRLRLQFPATTVRSGTADMLVLLCIFSHSGIDGRF
ncbi:hypothetical protein ABFV55_27935, partial [Pseudomonas syringae]|uniref:hypothetical protein n=1 Tax=Pseudomonas syringae TaxID=317 RepID=UPI0034D96F76